MDCHTTSVANSLPYPQKFMLASSKICIIGAGMSGLCTCKHLLEHGLEPVVLEATGGIGGVWQKTYATTKLQTPAFVYQFSDFPWPNGSPEFPSSRQVLDYFKSYADHFNFFKRIQFNCKVVSIHRLDEKSRFTGHWGDGGRPSVNSPSYCTDDVWEVHVQRKVTDGPNENFVDEKLRFDFIIMCTGRFGDVPRMPTFPPGKGADVFKGITLHAMDYSALDDHGAFELLKGKRVVVVGLQKSAVDAAMEAAIVNSGIDGHPCTLVYRKPRWILPNNLLIFGVPPPLLFYNRFMGMLVPKPDQGLFLSFLSNIFAPLRWGISKFVELYLLFNMPLRRYGLVPEESFYQQVASCIGSTLPDNFFSAVETGRIRLARSPNWSFCEKGVILDDGTEVEADVVILATGYDGNSKLKSLLPEMYKSVFQDDPYLIPWYRGIIHPRIPDIAAVGFMEGPCDLHNSEMGARWLSYFLTNKFRLPDIQTMEEEAKKWNQYFMSNATSDLYRTCTATIQVWWNDVLCRDMGWNPRRKKTWIAELFAPYTNLDYQEEKEEQQQHHHNNNKSEENEHNTTTSSLSHEVRVRLKTSPHKEA